MGNLCRLSASSVNQEIQERAQPEAIIFKPRSECYTFTNSIITSEGFVNIIGNCLIQHNRIEFHISSEHRFKLDLSTVNSLNLVAALPKRCIPESDVYRRFYMGDIFGDTIKTVLVIKAGTGDCYIMLLKNKKSEEGETIEEGLPKYTYLDLYITINYDIPPVSQV